MDRAAQLSALTSVHSLETYKKKEFHYELTRICNPKVTSRVP